MVKQRLIPWSIIAFVGLSFLGAMAFAASGYYSQCAAQHGLGMGDNKPCRPTYKEGDSDRSAHFNRVGAGHDGSVLSCNL